MLYALRVRPGATTRRVPGAANAVRPGLSYTDIHASGGEPHRVNRLKGTVPMQRGGRPDDVAHAVLRLLSDELSFTTGAILDVTGGR